MAWAFSPFPAEGAELTRELSERLASHSFATGPWRGGSMPTDRAEGALHQAAWRIDAPGASTLELLAPLRETLAQAGYATVFECAAAECGGFDFRFAIDVLPEPEMHVDLGDFRFLFARRDTAEGAERISLVISRSSQSGFVQVTSLGASAAPDARLVASSKAAQPAATGRETALTAITADTAVGQGGIATITPDGLARALQDGSVPLDDLTFESGAAGLAETRFASLDAVGAFLAANPATRLVIVGHTDASGSLAANRDISMRRAEAVRDRLVADHAIAVDRLDCVGAGYLEPRADNETPEGRLLNRRVEIRLAD